MAGSWEIINNESVMTCILHTDVVYTHWALGLRRLLIPGFPEPQLLAGMPYDMARNVGCMRALDAGADAVFFLDSDVIPPHDAILRLLAHKLPIVSGVYHRRSPPEGLPVAIKNGTWATHIKPNTGMHEVDLVGAGCLLLRREFLKSLPPIDPEIGRHWFSWRVDRGGLLPPGEALSEDFAMCLHAKKHGYRVWVDSSIQCLHAGAAQSEYGVMRPLGAA